LKTTFGVKAVGFMLCPTVPLLAPIGHSIHADWLTPLLFFVVLPALGRLLGTDRSPPAPAVASAWLRAYLRGLPMIYLPVWAVCLAWGASILHADAMSPLAITGLVFSLAIASALATCVAHELLHSSLALEQAVARAMLVLFGYGHLDLEHHFHHAQVGDVSCGATPLTGESSYAFVWRNTRQGFVNARRVERERLRRRGLSVWRNRVWQNYALICGLAVVVYRVWGSAALGLYVGQAMFSIYAVQMITYIQHYGLYRSAGSAVGPELAWADNCWIANCLTFNINHHSEHHMDARTPYYMLRPHPDAPRLPASYMLMFLVALVPPLWRKMIDGRLASFLGRRTTRTRDNLLRHAT
jgi:alkane 1-monooxygenase